MGIILLDTDSIVNGAEGYAAVDDFDTIIVSSGVTIASVGQTVAAGILGTSNTVQVGGLVAGLYGVRLGLIGSVNVLAGGVVFGTSSGVFMEGGGNRIDNDGTISASLTAILGTGSVDITNTGRISGAQSMSLSDFGDRVINRGLISGHANLGGGSDLFDGSGGVLIGAVFLGAGDDTALGGAGDDTFSDDGGRDLVDAGAGNDLILVTGDQLIDTFDGGAGIDTLSFRSFSTGVRVDLAAGLVMGGASGSDLIAGFEVVLGGAGVNRLTGDAHANTLVGRDAGDFLYGGAGNDVIRTGMGANHADGGAGDDRILAAEGADRLFGGTGNDVIWGSYDIDIMTGGDGTDRFLFRDVDELFNVTVLTGFDRITDFTPGEDLIDLSAIDWNGTGGDNVFAFRGTAAIDGPGQVAIRQAGAATFVDISWQTAGTAGSIRLDGLLTLTAADFIL